MQRRGALCVVLALPLCALVAPAFLLARTPERQGAHRALLEVQIAKHAAPVARAPRTTHRSQAQHNLRRASQTQDASKGRRKEETGDPVAQETEPTPSREAGEDSTSPDVRQPGEPAEAAPTNADKAPEEGGITEEQGETSEDAQPTPDKYSYVDSMAKDVAKLERHPLRPDEDASQINRAFTVQEKDVGTLADMLADAPAPAPQPENNEQPPGPPSNAIVSTRKYGDVTFTMFDDAQPAAAPAAAPEAAPVGPFDRVAAHDEAAPELLPADPYKRPLATASEMSPELSAQLQVENRLPAFREQASPTSEHTPEAFREDLDEETLMTRPPAPVLEEVTLSIDGAMAALQASALDESTPAETDEVQTHAGRSPPAPEIREPWEEALESAGGQFHWLKARMEKYSNVKPQPPPAPWQPAEPQLQHYLEGDEIERDDAQNKEPYWATAHDEAVHTWHQDRAAALGVEKVSEDDRLWRGKTLTEQIRTAFVMFLVEREIQKAEQFRVEYAFRSACRVAPRAKMFVLSDMDTNLTFLDKFGMGFAEPGVAPCSLNIRRTLKLKHTRWTKDDIGYHHMMEEAKFLETMAENHVRQHVVFIGSNVLFTQSLDPLWQNNRFDVALTYHDQPKRPFATAVKYVYGSEGNLRAVSKLWQEGEVAGAEAAKNITKARHCANCESDAFFTAVMNNVPATARDELYMQVVHERTWHYSWDHPGAATLDIMMMPCNDYSAVPGSEEMCGCKATLNTKVIHFKGNLITQMTHFWRDIERGRPMGAVQRATAGAIKFRNARCGDMPSRERRLEIKRFDVSNAVYDA